MLGQKIREYPLTFILIFSNILVYVALMLSSQNIVDMDLETLVHFGALFAPYVVLDDEWWRLLTAMFLHGGMTHLLMNVVSLYLLGRMIEGMVFIHHYFILYLLTGVFGGIVSLWVHPMSVGVGASGAIFGLFGMIVAVVWRRRKENPLEAKRTLKEFGAIFGLNLLIGIVIPEIDVSAHLAGFFTGILGGFLLTRYPRGIWIFSTIMLVLIVLSMEMLSQEYADILF